MPTPMIGTLRWPCFDHRLQRRKNFLARSPVAPKKTGLNVDQFRDRARESIEKHGGGVDPGLSMTERHVFVERNRRRMFFCRYFDSLRYIDATFPSGAAIEQKACRLCPPSSSLLLTIDNKLRCSLRSMTQKSKPLAGWLNPCSSMV